MKDEIIFTRDDSVAIIAPHPDDEINVAGAMIFCEFLPPLGG